MRVSTMLKTAQNDTSTTIRSAFKLLMALKAKGYRVAKGSSYDFATAENDSIGPSTGKTKLTLETNGSHWVIKAHWPEEWGLSLPGATGAPGGGWGKLLQGYMSLNKKYQMGQEAAALKDLEKLVKLFAKNS